MTGKETCAILKQIRRDIAKQNDINLRIDECTHKGECKGTCPRCEAEVRALEKALAERKKRGQRVAVAGISAGIVTFNMAACQPIDNILEHFGIFKTAGDMQVIEPLDGDVYAETDVEGTAGPVTLTGELVEFPETDEPPLPTAGVPMPPSGYWDEEPTENDADAKPTDAETTAPEPAKSIYERPAGSPMPPGYWDEELTEDPAEPDAETTAPEPSKSNNETPEVALKAPETAPKAKNGEKL